MAQQHSQTQRVQTTIMDINIVPERDTTTTAPRLTHSTVDTTGDQPKNWRVTSRESSRPVRFPERWLCARRHRRPGELRRDSETAARVSSLEQTIFFQVVRDRCAFSNEQDDARRRVDFVGRLWSPTGQERFPGMTISYALLQTIEKMSEKPNKVRIITTAQHDSDA